jgi:hypothetical protein
MQYGVFYMHRFEQSGEKAPINQPAYTVAPLRMNPRGSKHVGENRN